MLATTYSSKIFLCLHQYDCKVNHVLLCMLLSRYRAGETLFSNDVYYHCWYYYHYMSRDRSVHASESKTT